MFRYFSFLFLLLLISCTGKSSIYSEISKITPEENHIYLFYRETKSKSGIVAQSYNNFGSHMSHIGIGLVDKNKKFIIYHILEKKTTNNKNDVWSSSLQDFYDNKNEKIIGAEVWKNKTPLSETKISSLRFTLDSLAKSNVKFDMEFNFEDHKKMYCSEFAYFALKKIDDFKITPSLSKQELKGIQKSFLGVSTLYYLPVDFLYPNKSFTKLYSRINEVVKSKTKS